MNIYPYQPPTLGVITDGTARAAVAAAGITDVAAITRLNQFFAGLCALGLHDDLIDGAALRYGYQTGTTGVTLRGYAATTTHGAPTRGLGGYQYDGVDDGHEWTIPDCSGARTSFVWASGVSGVTGNILHFGIINSAGAGTAYHITQTETGTGGGIARTWNAATAIVAPPSSTTNSGVPETHMLCATDSNAGTAGSLKLYVDGDAALSAASGAVNAQTLTRCIVGAYRGSGSPSAWSKVCVGAWLVFNKELSSTEVANVRALVERTICPRYIVLAEGDSLTAATGWPEYCGDQAAVWGFTETQNIATGGHATTDVSSGYTAQIGAVKPSSGQTKWLALMIGANDIANTSDSAATIFARIAAIWALARRDGYKVAAFTVTNGAGVATRSAVHSALNVLIRNAGTSYDLLIDADMYFQRLVGSATYHTNTTYFDTDNIHFKTAGKQALAGYAASLFQFPA